MKQYAIAASWWPGLILLLAATLAAYANSFGGVFQFDDYRVITLNPQVQSMSAWWADMPGMRAMLKLSFTLDLTSGLGVAGFHLTNLAIHLVNVLLVYVLCRRFDPSTHAWFAFAAALMFALHPVNTEAVTYVSGRSSSLMSLFYLASLLSYDMAGRSGRSGWLPISVFLFLMAMACKETAATLPLAMLLWDATTQREHFRWQDSLRRQAWHWGIIVLAAGVFFSAPVYRRLIEVSFALRSFEDNLLTHLHAMVWLTGQWWWPFELNADPRLPTIQNWSPISVLEAVAIAFSAGWSILNLRRHPVMAFGVLWCLLQWLPPLAMARLDPANERQLYLAGIGLAMLAAQALLRLSPRQTAVILMLMAMLLGGLTHMRNRTYANEIVFWEDVARKSPENARAWNNLGFAYREAGRVETAEMAYLKALELDPAHRRARFNLEALWREADRNQSDAEENQ